MNVINYLPDPADLQCDLFCFSPAAKANGGARVKDKTSIKAHPVDLGRLGSFLGFRLRRVQNQLSRDFGAKTCGHELRAGMFSALEIIAANDGISQALLSSEVGLDKSALVPLVDDLEGRGWVTRTRSTADRRRNHLAITAVGRIALDELLHHMAETEAKALAALSDEERETISAALDTIYHAYVRPSP